MCTVCLIEFCVRSNVYEFCTMQVMYMCHELNNSFMFRSCFFDDVTILGAYKWKSSILRCFFFLKCDRTWLLLVTHKHRETERGRRESAYMLYHENCMQTQYNRHRDHHSLDINTEPYSCFSKLC